MILPVRIGFFIYLFIYIYIYRQWELDFLMLQVRTRLFWYCQWELGFFMLPVRTRFSWYCQWELVLYIYIYIYISPVRTELFDVASENWAFLILPMRIGLLINNLPWDWIMGFAFGLDLRVGCKAYMVILFQKNCKYCVTFL